MYNTSKVLMFAVTATCTLRKQVLMNFFSGFLAGSCINETNSSQVTENLTNSLLVHRHLHSLFRLTDRYAYWQEAAWWGAHVLEDLNPERFAHSDCHVLIPDSFQLILSCSKQAWGVTHLEISTIFFTQYKFPKLITLPA